MTPIVLMGLVVAGAREDAARREWDRLVADHHARQAELSRRAGELRKSGQMLKLLQLPRDLEPLEDFALHGQRVSARFARAPAALAALDFYGSAGAYAVPLGDERLLVVRQRTEGDATFVELYAEDGTLLGAKARTWAPLTEVRRAYDAVRSEPSRPRWNVKWDPLAELASNDLRRQVEVLAAIGEVPPAVLPLRQVLALVGDKREQLRRAAAATLEAWGERTAPVKAELLAAAAASPDLVVRCRLGAPLTKGLTDAQLESALRSGHVDAERLALEDLVSKSPPDELARIVSDHTGTVLQDQVRARLGARDAAEAARLDAAIGVTVGALERAADVNDAAPKPYPNNVGLKVAAVLRCLWEQPFEVETTREKLCPRLERALGRSWGLTATLTTMLERPIDGHAGEQGPAFAARCLQHARGEALRRVIDKLETPAVFTFLVALGQPTLDALQTRPKSMNAAFEAKRRELEAALRK